MEDIPIITDTVVTVLINRTEKMMGYNGHKNWSQWNVSLWINNDEGLYNLMRDCIRVTCCRGQAAEEMLSCLNECGITKTPDGAKYTKTSIRKAMVGM